MFCPHEKVSFVRHGCLNIHALLFVTASRRIETHLYIAIIVHYNFTVIPITMSNLLWYTGNGWFTGECQYE